MLMTTRAPGAPDAAQPWVPLFAEHALHADDPRGVGPDPLAVDCPGASAHQVDPEQRLYARGASSSFAYIIVSGIVRFERVTAAGVRRISRVAGHGQLIGQEALLRQAYRDDAVVCTPATLRRIPAALLDQADWPAGGLPLALMRRWQATLDESEFWSTEVSVGPARRRVLQLLDRLQRHRDAQGRIWMPRRDQMGDMLNQTIETCSRVLSALRREGVVELLPARHAKLDDTLLAAAMARSNR